MNTDEDGVYELEITSSETEFFIKFPGSLSNRYEFIVINVPQKISFYVENPPSEEMIKTTEFASETVVGAVQVTAAMGSISSILSSFFPMLGLGLFIRTLQTFDILTT